MSTFSSRHEDRCDRADLTCRGRRAAASEPAEHSRADVEGTVDLLLEVIEPIVESDPAGAPGFIRAWMAALTAGRDDEFSPTIVAALHDILDDVAGLPDDEEKVAAYRAGELHTIRWDQAKRKLDL